VLVSSAVGAEEDRAGELLDHIDALRVFRADTPEEKERLLEEIAGTGRVEQDIVDQLSKVRPLWRPLEFSAAHRMMMRSLEVLDRNGVRRAPMPRWLGPVRPVVAYIVQLVTRWIVRDYQNNLASSVRRLYERREANCEWGSADHVLLRRARINAVQVEQGLKSRRVGLPGFLVGGVVLSGLFSLIGRGMSAAIGNRIARVVITLLVVAILLGLSWVAIKAASIARKRIRLSTDQPARVLYDAIGAAGNPPHDRSYQFAVLAIIFLLLAVLAIPVVVSVFVG
jgi:hypothetical protein